jgi:NitT/TauT family transport system substrate-binding protein
MLMRRALAGLLAILAVLIPAASCSTPTPAPLRIGLAVFPSFELFFLARAKGWLGDDIDLVEYSSPGDPMRGYQEGAIDAVALTTLYALDVAQRLPDTRIVLLLDSSSGADAIIAGPAVPNLAALKGRRVGVYPTLLGPYLLRRALDRASIAREDVTVVPVAGGDQVGDQEAALATGRVDAIATSEPIASMLVARGNRAIFTSADIPNEIMDVLLVRASLLERDRPRLQQVAEAWFKARAAFLASPETTAPLIAGRDQLTPAQFIASFRGLELPDRPGMAQLLSGSNPRLLESLTHVADAMRKEGWLRDPVAPRSLIDAALVAGDAR